MPGIYGRVEGGGGRTMMEVVGITTSLGDIVVLWT